MGRISQSLIDKYNISGPRYTSYPPVPYWRNCPTENEWASNIKSKYEQYKSAQLYIHIPYCESLCYYCGCNRKITKNHQVEQRYIQTLIKELDLYYDILGKKNIIVDGIHLGGGTPTFLSPSHLDFLLSEIYQRIKLKDNFEGAIEVDPRVTTEEHLKILKKWNFQKISLGIQDFNKDVQQKINRIQNYDLVKKLVQECRKYNIKSVNFDLIYGLPGQNTDTIKETIDKVKTLSPDTIAFYGYAHVPWAIPTQKLLEKYHIPSGPEKWRLYEYGRDLLESSHYYEIGMDHFTKKTDRLFLSLKKKKIFRNFMGYTIFKTPIIIALGASSISNSEKSFVQNEKDIEQYIEKVSRRSFPIVKGHTLLEKDLFVSHIIQEIMCKKKFSLEDLEKVFKEEEIVNIRSSLKKMMTDRIIDFNEKEEFTVREEGKPFLRNICMIFDFHLNAKKNSGNRFAKTI